MALRTVEEIAASVMRRTGGYIPRGEVLDAIDSSNNEIHGKYEWPWTRSESNIQVQGTYNTGTVSITDGTTLVTLAGGGVWDPNWKYKRIYFGSNNVDYLVSSFTANTATLAQPVNLGTNLVNVSYIVFQDMYPLPSDCEFGSILLVVNPYFRYKLKYIQTYTLDWQAIYSRVFFSQFQSAFSDCGYDDTGKIGLIRLAPAPGSVAEYRLVYRRRPPDLNTFAQTSMLPPMYDRVLESLAEYKVRFHQKTPLPGWQECYRAANDLMKDMRRKVSVTMYDNYSRFSMYGPYESSSVYDGASGTFIGVTTP